MPSPELSHLLSSITPSATLGITNKAKALRAQGVDVISFGAGEPDFPTPDHIVEAAERACRDVTNHKYSPTAGLPALREAVAVTTRRSTSLAVEPDQVLITNGGKHGVFNAMATILNPGDEVLLPAPYWVTYPEAVALSGGVVVEVPTDESTAFRVTVEMLDAAVTDRTTALIFVSPSNPTGSMYSPSEIEAIGKWAVERRIWVLSDEIYEHLVYGENRFVSMPAIVPELADQCIVVNGVSKAYSMTGWRVGWMIGPRPAIATATSFQSHVTSNVSNVAQAAALAALTGSFESVEEMRRAFDRRRMTMHAMLSAIPGVSTVESQGAFYEFPSFKSIIDGPLRGKLLSSTIDLADLALDAARVAFVPGEAFGSPGYARFSYALGEEDLRAGLERLGALLTGG